ncbi:hypothetical protein H5410_060605 [Solanum commersonii]|uniref:Retrotransposon gag domain-containing protein n=1 Tax=Solanum commersonii TaxID=4109 RepID=A0A9J5W652_SOLCO|nr:hypothetical protein H5410_060605 [Solanum commersonii]
MWKNLKKVYSQCNHARDFELEHTLSEYKQGDKDIQSYYSGLMAIWSEQDQSFGGNLSSTGFKDVMLERKKNRVVQFLMKLSPDFEPIRANILNRKTLPDINVVFGELIREETRINNLASMDLSYTIGVAMYTSKECNRCPNTHQTKNKAYQASEAYVSQAEITPSSLDLKAVQKMIHDSVAAALPKAISSALIVAYPDSVSFLYKFENQQVQNLTSPNEDPNGITDDPSQSDACHMDNSGNSTLSHISLNTFFTDSSDNNDYSDWQPIPSDQINSSIPSLCHSELKTYAPDRYGYSPGLELPNMVNLGAVLSGLLDSFGGEGHFFIPMYGSKNVVL